MPSWCCRLPKPAPNKHHSSQYSIIPQLQSSFKHTPSQRYKYSSSEATDDYISNPSVCKQVDRDILGTTYRLYWPGLMLAHLSSYLRLRQQLSLGVLSVMIKDCELVAVYPYALMISPTLVYGHRKASITETWNHRNTSHSRCHW